jgi:hypothetical protein
MTPISVAVGAMIVAYAARSAKGMAVLETAIEYLTDEASRAAVVHLRAPRRSREATEAIDAALAWLTMLRAFARAKRL